MPVVTGIETRADTPSIFLEHGDVVRTPEGLTATVHMVYYDRFHTGNSPDLIELEFGDGSKQRAYSTADYVADVIKRVEKPEPR